MKQETQALVDPSDNDSYQIPQKVTSPVERREIRNFIELRQSQIKSRLDRIYKWKKEQFVEQEYHKKIDDVKKNQQLASLVKQYNKDNKKIEALKEQRESLKDEIDKLCEAKSSVSEKLIAFAKKDETLNYDPSRYGNATDRHSDKTIEVEELIYESQVKDRIKADFDDKNSDQMEKRNRRLKYLKEKIEERLLFGKRDELQELFSKLEKMNTQIEAELVNLGIDSFTASEDEGI